MGCLSVFGQAEGNADAKRDIFSDIGAYAETQVTVGKGLNPLWLNANKYGLSSLDSDNGYLRVAVERDVAADSTRRWGVGYGLDIATAYNTTSSFIVQQAYFEGRYKLGSLTIGSKQQPMELRDNELASGAQTSASMRVLCLRCVSGLTIIGRFRYSAGGSPSRDISPSA